MAYIHLLIWKIWQQCIVIFTTGFFKYFTPNGFSLVRLVLFIAPQTLKIVIINSFYENLQFLANRT